MILVGNDTDIKGDLLHKSFYKLTAPKMWFIKQSPLTVHLMWPNLFKHPMKFDDSPDDH